VAQRLLHADEVPPSGSDFGIRANRGYVTVGAVRREYLYTPLARTVPRPLLMVLHGGFGTGAGLAGMGSMLFTAARAGFVSAFPDGIHRSWNDGRSGPAIDGRSKADDVGFLLALIDELTWRGVADPSAVFVCGISNGAFMTDRLAREAGDRLRGIGLVCGTRDARSTTPARGGPLPVMGFFGTADPLIPYAGGPVGFERLRARGGASAQRATGARGTAMAAEVLAADWARHNGIAGPPAVDALPPGPDGLPITRLTWWEPGRAPVVLHRIEGGGHTWPNGPQYLPVRLIGPTSTGIDATATLLDFFGRVLTTPGL
jgi:polyhydroxybutyrate depolymerase